MEPDDYQKNIKVKLKIVKERQGKEFGKYCLAVLLKKQNYV